MIRLLVRSHRKAGRSQSANPLIRRTGHEASFAPSGQSSRSSGFNTRDAPDTDVSFREQTRSAADAASHSEPILNEHCTTSWGVLSRHTPYILWFVIKSICLQIVPHETVLRASAPRRYAVQRLFSSHLRSRPQPAERNRPPPVLRRHLPDADGASDAAA